MPRVRTAYRQPVPLQRDLASRVTLVHRRAQLDVPCLQNRSAHQLHPDYSDRPIAHEIVPVHNLDIVAGCMFLIIFGLPLGSFTWTRSSTWTATPQLRTYVHGPSSAR